jgi:hypothetical protein
MTYIISIVTNGHERDQSIFNQCVVNLELALRDCSIAKPIESARFGFDTQGSEVEIKKHSLKILRKTSVNDTLIFHFVGHGRYSPSDTLEFYLHGNEDNLAPDSVLMNVKDFITFVSNNKEIGRGKVWLIMDFCYSSQISKDLKWSKQTDICIFSSTSKLYNSHQRSLIEPNLFKDKIQEQTATPYNDCLIYALRLNYSLSSSGDFNLQQVGEVLKNAYSIYISTLIEAKTIDPSIESRLKNVKPEYTEQADFFMFQSASLKSQEFREVLTYITNAIIRPNCDFICEITQKESSKGDLIDFSVQSCNKINHNLSVEERYFYYLLIYFILHSISRFNTSQSEQQLLRQKILSKNVIEFIWEMEYDFLKARFDNLFNNQYQPLLKKYGNLKLKFDDFRDKEYQPLLKEYRNLLDRLKLSTRAFAAFTGCIFLAGILVYFYNRNSFKNVDPPKNVDFSNGKAKIICQLVQSDDKNKIADDKNKIEITRIKNQIAINLGKDQFESLTKACKDHQMLESSFSQIENVAVRNLDLSNLGIRSLNFFSVLSLSSLSIKSINLSQNELDSNDFQDLDKIVKENIINLDISRNKREIDNLNFFEDYKSLISLNISDNILCKSKTCKFTLPPTLEILNISNVDLEAV